MGLKTGTEQVGNLFHFGKQTRTRCVLTNDLMFDPTLPLAGTEIDAVQMRDQLNGLKALIDAVTTLDAAQVDSTDTLSPGNPATASVVVMGSALHFSFAIPRGNDGAPGEVTTAQLDTAIQGTSANTNAVTTLDSSFSDPDVEALRQKLNELIVNGRM